MRRLLLWGLVPVLALVAVGFVVIGYQDSSHVKPADVQPAVAEEQEEPPPPPGSGPPPPYNGVDARQYDPMDPPMKRLLHSAAKYDPHHTTRFFLALTDVFRQNGLTMTEYEPGWGIDEGYAVELTVGDKKYVVAVLRGWANNMPGDDTQYLFLLREDGKILDRLYCAIGAWHTHADDYRGTFRTDIAAKPEEDGARLVVRFRPAKGHDVAGEWTHKLVTHGLLRTIRWNVGQAGEPSSAELVDKGLCRVTIRDDKFSLTYPN